MATAPGLIRRIDATGIPLLVARLFVGGMFAYLAIKKLMDPLDFLKQLHLYHVLPTQPPELVNGIAAAMPWLELLCAAALILGISLRGAAAIVIGMLLFFYPLLIGRALSLLAEHKFATFCAVNFDCGCGNGPRFICPKLAENTALMIAALIPLFSASRRFCLSTLFGHRREALPPVMVGAAAGQGSA